ncbi:MAG: B12-binding domain-containing radical SAM protein, partial [Candidatus Muiribacteriaceae bacterium]
MSVSLVYMPNTSKKDYEEFYFPNGLLYIYASLKRSGFDTDLIMLEPEALDLFVQDVADKDIICFSVNISNKVLVFEAAEEIKKHCDVTVVMGGPFITLMKDDDLLRFEYADVFFKGEAENMLPDYLKNMTDERIIRCPRIEMLDSLAIPAEQGVIYNNIITSRGCPGKCTFCASPRLWGRKVKLRSASNIFREMSVLYKAGVDYFVFSDDCFTVSMPRLKELFGLIEESGMNIIFDVRTRTDLVNEEILDLLAYNGCVSLSFGIESASERMLKMLDKEQDLVRAEKMIRACAVRNIRTNLFFITGIPGEDEKDIAQNVGFIRRCRPDWITAYGLHLFPGTRLEDETGCDVDWMNLKSTYYLCEQDTIDRNILRMKRAHMSVYTGDDIEVKPGQKNLFSYYFDLAVKLSDPDAKEELLNLSLDLYPSAEAYILLGETTGDKDIIRKGISKMVFQYIEGLRKNPG